MSPAPPARAPRGPATLKSKDPLRESFFALFVRSYVRAESTGKGQGLRVYRSTLDLLLEFFRQGWVQITLVPGEVNLARRFWADTGLHGDRNGFVAWNLLCNSWAPMWTGAILKHDAENFAKYCRATGLDRLRKARADGKGVILAHSHTLFTQLFWRWLEHQRMDAGITLWQWTWDKRKEEWEDPKRRALESAREMHAAAGLLRDGGIVHSLADGRWGSDRYWLPFFGRKRVFQKTFAELAVLTGVPVYPVDVILQRDGRVVIEFGTRFDPGPDDLKRDERVEHLVQQYARHLAGLWQRHPENLEWYQMQRHLRMPTLSGT